VIVVFLSLIVVPPLLFVLLLLLCTEKSFVTCGEGFYLLIHRGQEGVRVRDRLFGLLLGLLRNERDNDLSVVTFTLTFVVETAYEVSNFVN